MIAGMHPAVRLLASRLGPVCFGDVSPGDPTPKSYKDIAIDKTVRAVLDFANQFAPPNKQYKTMEQVAADHSLFGATLPKEEEIASYAKSVRKIGKILQKSAPSPETAVDLARNDALQNAARAEYDDFLAQRAWVANAIMTFRRFGYDGLPDLIPDSESSTFGY